jgi:deoxyribonuclease V
VDLFIFDGQGIAHPRKMGIASHIGLWLDKPTIGCAKSFLYGRFNPPGSRKGDFAYIYDKHNRKIGACLRSRNNIKPIYISPGHKMDTDKAIDIILSCVGNFRIPEPLRAAHIKAHV